LDNKEKQGVLNTIENMEQTRKHDFNRGTCFSRESVMQVPVIKQMVVTFFILAYTYGTNGLSRIRPPYRFKLR